MIAYSQILRLYIIHGTIPAGRIPSQDLSGFFSDADNRIGGGVIRNGKEMDCLHPGADDAPSALRAGGFGLDVPELWTGG